MKKIINAKLFLQVMVASIVATLATAGIVAAVTTIGANITTAGTLNVDSGTLYVGSTDRVGVGTTTPFATLSINNTAGENAFVIGSSTATWLKVDASGLLTVAKGATFSSTLGVTGATTLTGALSAATTTIALGDFTVGGTDFYVDDDNARVGIGSSTPSSTLSLGTGTATTTVMGVKFCQYFQDEAGRGMWIKLATSGNTVFATSTTPCNQ